MLLFLSVVLILPHVYSINNVPGIYVELNDGLLRSMKNAVEGFIHEKLHYNLNIHSDYKNHRCMDPGEHYTLYHKLKRYAKPKISLSFRERQQDIYAKIDFDYVDTHLKLYNSPSIFYWMNYILIYTHFTSVSVSLQISPKIGAFSNEIYLKSRCSARGNVDLNFKGFIIDIINWFKKYDKDIQRNFECFICPIVERYFNSKSHYLLPSSEFSFLSPRTIILNARPTRSPYISDNQLILPINGRVTGDCERPQDVLDAVRIRDVGEYEMKSGMVDIQISEDVFNSAFQSLYRCGYLTYTHEASKLTAKTLKNALPQAYKNRTWNEFRVQGFAVDKPYVNITKQNTKLNFKIAVQIGVENLRGGYDQIAEARINMKLEVQPFLQKGVFFASVAKWESDIGKISGNNLSKQNNKELRKLFDMIMSLILQPFVSDFLENIGYEFPQYFEDGNNKYIKYAKLQQEDYAAVLSIDFKNLLDLVMNFYHAN